MTGITDPSEEFFKDGVWAWVSTAWKKLVADASNFLQVNVAAQDIDIEVKQQAAADLTPGVMGWDGSAWRKLPLVWGYSGQYLEHEQSTGVAAGDHNLVFSTVPAGEIWIITSFSARCSTANPELVALGMVSGGTFQRFMSRTYTVTQETIELTGSLILVAGEKAHTFFDECHDGDSIYADACGYKMKIAE